jgi:hypothetical protein
MGGGFGGKETQSGHLAVWAALAAHKTGRPVKMRLSREDDFLVTGKRHRAHNGNDPGEWDDVGIYYFKWSGEGFVKQVIEYGPIGQATGCGIHFAIADVTNSGRLDIVAPGKDGLYLFVNLGSAQGK